MEHIVTIVPIIDLVKEFYTYSECYYTAAHEVASLLIEKDIVDTSKFDTYILPLVFLYRHSLELLLKSIAFTDISENSKRAEFVKETHHDLATILDTIIEDRRLCLDQALVWLEEFFSDISRLDKDSDSFRYPFNIIRTHNTINGIHYSIKKVFEKQTYIDLYKIANKFELAYDITISLYKSGMCSEELSEFHPVLIEDGDNYFQAVMGYGANWSGYSQYVHGYKDAAHFLRILMDKSNNADKFLFPMCYLYRNAVELALKEVWIDECKEDYQTRLKLLNRKKHNVAGIWKAIRLWDENFWSDDKYDIEIQQYFDSISDRCMKINNRDANADRFRYPCNKFMNLNYRKVTKINYMEIANFMENLYDDIDCVDMELYHRNDLYNKLGKFQV